jgi:hypothetical protein
MNRKDIQRMTMAIGGSLMLFGSGVFCAELGIPIALTLFICGLGLVIIGN